ncbi:MAG TPA: L-dopachrome tautomerase-related protein [Rhodopila sp.]|nr:L-dopachrome tautomerase-related protein [Rhodopila sp.]
MKNRGIVAAVLLAMAAATPHMATAAPPQKYGPTLTTVKSFDDFALVGLGVSHEGRIFASAPAATSGNKLIEVNPATGAVTPYPDQGWNQQGGDTAHEWSVPQAMWVDTADNLWVLDSGRAVLAGGQPIPPKLVEFDLKTNKVIRSYGFEGVVAPTDSLNDVRIDLTRGYAYISNIGNKGSLVVLNLATGASRQVLVGDRSAYADPRQHLMIGNQPALDKNGKVVAIHADGIELSPDGAWVWYRPLTDHNYWRISTDALVDSSLTPAALSKKVQFLGTAEETGGLIMDQHGTLYGGDLEHGTVVALTLNPKTGKLKSKLFLRDPGNLSWADGFAISGGYMYIADSHLWEIVFKNHLPRSGPWKIFKVKLPD